MSMQQCVYIYILSLSRDCQLTDRHIDRIMPPSDKTQTSHSTQCVRLTRGSLRNRQVGRYETVDVRNSFRQCIIVSLYAWALSRGPNDANTRSCEQNCTMQLRWMNLDSKVSVPRSVFSSSNTRRISQKSYIRQILH